MASAYKSYISELSDDESREFIDNINKLYLKDNRTMREISDILNLDFNIIRGCISHNNIKKSKDMQYKRIVESSAKTNIERYGTRCSLNSESSIKKKKDTWIKKYGVDNPSKLDIIKSKKEATSLEHYGTRSPLMSEEIKSEIQNTNIKRYGVSHPLKSDIIKNKIKSTNIERYGVSNTFQLQKSRDKAVDSMRENIPEDIKEILYNKDKYKEFILSIPDEDRTFSNICAKLNYYTSTIPRMYYKYELTDIPIQFYKSQYEIEIKDYINSISNIAIIPNDKKIIHPYELDLYIPDKNLGIEFNGDYWHSELKKEFDYHKKKSLYAKDKNIFIYHIWEHEWNDPRKQKIIKSQLNNLLRLSDRIYARKCIVKEVSSKDSREFLNNNHIQGNRNSSIKLGLYYNNELVSLMTFGMNKFIRKNSDNIELLRFCNKLNTTVIGGASKLFKYFLDNYDYDNIVSYCNISKGIGKLYENLEFELDSITSPNYIWLNLRTGDIKSRYQCQMKNEYDIMTSQGYIQLFDCGNYKYIYRRKKVI